MRFTTAPVAGRLQRPSWTDPRLLVGVALVAVAVFATTSIVANADRTEPYYAARHTLTPGTVLDESDLVVASVRVGGGTYVPATDAPWGQVVTRVVGKGEILPEASISEASAFASRPVAIETSRPLSGAIEPGAVVDVWVTRDGSLGTVSELVAEGVVVEEVDREGSAFSTRIGETVYVLVPADDVGGLLSSLADAEEVAVVGLGGAAA